MFLTDDQFVDGFSRSEWTNWEVRAEFLVTWAYIRRKKYGMWSDLRSPGSQMCINGFQRCRCRSAELCVVNLYVYSGDENNNDKINCELLFMKIVCFCTWLCLSCIHGYSALILTPNRLWLPGFIRAPDVFPRRNCSKPITASCIASIGDVG